VKQSLSFHTHKHHAGSDITASINMATQYVNDQGGGFPACVVMFCSLLGCLFLILAGGIHINNLGREKTVSCLLAGLALVVPCLKPIFGTLNGSRSHALIPSWQKVDPSMQSTVEQCSCVLITGLVILTPIVFDLGATTVNILGNAVVTLCKLAYRSGGQFQTKNKSIKVTEVRSMPLSDELWSVKKITGEAERLDPNFKILSKSVGGVPTGDLLLPGTLIRVRQSLQVGHMTMLELSDGRGWAVGAAGEADSQKVCTKLPHEQASCFVETEYSIQPGFGVAEGSWLLLHESLQEQSDMQSEVRTDEIRDSEWHDVRIHGLNPLTCTFESGKHPHRIVAFHHSSQPAPMPWFQFYQLNRMSFILFKSVRNPSSIFIVPTLVYHLFHFVIKLVPIGIQQGGLSGFTVVYMSFTNSGAMSFVMMAMFGGSLVGCMKYADLTLKFWVDPTQFRFTGAVLLILIIIPSMPLVAIGMISFFWFSFSLEMVIAFLTLVVFPVEFEEIASFVQDILEFTYDIVSCKECSTLTRDLREDPRGVVLGLPLLFVAAIFLLLTFPCFPLAKILAQKIGIEHEASPLGPLASVFAVFFFIMLKVIEWQFCFNAANMFLFMDVQYFDALPLSYLSRHWRCNSCLMEAELAHTELSILAWLQFYSMF